MNWNHAVIVAVPAILIGSATCGGQRIPPQSLADARTDVVRVEDGIAMQLDPTDVHEAEVALQRAEMAWQNAPDDPNTAAMVLIADRKALIAQARAMAMKADQEAQQATRQLEANRAAQLQTAKGELNQTRQALGATEMQLQQQHAAAVAQQQRMQVLEANLKDARDTIAQIASVKDDDRGMVITLQGEVLFKTAKSDLKPAAMAKLDQIAQALESKDQPIVVYGYTDNVGTRENNMDLSQRRAETVRGYLVSKGVPSDLVTAHGQGPDAPVADNESIEGRAQNRRVEIVVQPKK
jgi:outer membrane protein OmpA-like peptidoglycan-associated protein